MKNSGFACLAVALTIASYADERPVQSKITSVTVFRDRAQVTRTFSGKLPEGVNDLVFDNLPENIEYQSVTVQGTGNGVLRDIRVRRKAFAGSNDSISDYLNRKKKRYKDSLSVVDDQLNRCAGERQLVENIAAKITERGATQQVSAPELDHAKWLGMVDFYKNQLETISSEIRSAASHRQELEDTLSVIERRISDLGRDERSDRNQAVVSFILNNAGNVNLELSYIVYGPSWTPAYEIRILSDSKILRMTYKGSLSQSTGEDWSDVGVKLSTAVPHIGGNQPELSPWYIRFYEPQVRHKKYEALAKPRAASPAMMNQMMSVDGEIERLQAEIESAPLMVEDAEVESGATAFVFSIPGKTNIKSDNEEHTVTITTTEFPANFRYSAVPKLSQFAYLKAKVQNKTEFPLLPGPSNVFLDNSFVAKSTMRLVAPQEEFWTFLGVDESIKIKHKLINKMDRDDGVIAKKNRNIFSYQIEVSNNRKTEEEIVIWDQLPISGSEDIKVELLEPKWKENTDTLKKNDHEYLEWYFKLKPGESITIPFKFAVEYPKGRTVEGL